MIPVIIGSRGSPLALAQTRLVMADLKKKWPGRNFEIHVIKTEGDRLSENLGAGDTRLEAGLFTKELEQALLNKEIELAVHSLKDMPTAGDTRLMVAAIPKRADASDVLITRSADLSEALPRHAIVATGSPRRAAQLSVLRQDLKTEEIRGNIDTRLRKFRENMNWSGLILAAAGLERLKPDLTGLSLTVLPYSQMLPAPGQGALALQTRTQESTDIRSLISVLHDAETAAAVKAERMFLHALGGGCREPIAAYAEINEEGLLRLEGIAWLIGEYKPRRGEIIGRLDQAEELGVELAMRISQ